MSVFKKIMSFFNNLTDDTVLADDTALARIPTKDNFLTKEFEEDLLAFYDQLPAPMKYNVYHDDFAFFREIMIDMYKQCLGNSPFILPKADLRTCNDIYNDVWVRRLTGVSDLTEAYKSIKKSRSYVDDVTLQQLIIISWDRMESENSVPRTIESDDLSRMVKSEVIGDPVGDSGAEKQYHNDPDYGLVPEKPIFVDGFMGSHTYLSMLKTDKGELLRTERKGSMRAEGIEGPVDIYDTFRANNQSAYGTIYICIYGNSTSDQAPKGYSLGSGIGENVKKPDPITGGRMEQDRPARMVCRNCRHDYTEGDRYCRYCGAPLGEPWEIQEEFQVLYGPDPADISDSLILTDDFTNY